MRTHRELTERLASYTGAKYLYTEEGYIAWQCSTGENCEILFIEAKEKHKGAGTNLLRKLCTRITPYHSVFVIRRACNEEAGAFYRALGFIETTIPNLYKNEDAVLGTVSYKDLCATLGV